jgi:aspartyl-tRNA(Asn)/glutamyl-tRNA(Gln) amidotransferase subunit A
LATEPLAPDVVIALLRAAGAPADAESLAERIAAGASNAVAAVRALRGPDPFLAEPSDFLSTLESLAPRAADLHVVAADEALPVDSLCGLAARMRRGETSCVAATRAALDRAQEATRRLNCFIALDERRALAAAEAADRLRASGAALGPLHGVPLAHKDMFMRRGAPVSFGSAFGLDAAPETACVLERLDAAGAVTIGRLHMAEFALGPTGHNAIHGPCRNAVDPDYIAGGSSSGSGVAVGAGVVAGSLGSDTGGSVRIPACVNGVVGVKPTYGRIPRHGAMKLAPSIDVLGPIARTVRDAARLLRVVAGHDPRDPWSTRLPVPDYEAALGPVAGLRVGVAHRYYGDDLDPQVAHAIEGALARLQADGARLVEVETTGDEHLAELSRAIVYPEAAALHAAMLRDAPGRYGPQTRMRAASGIAIPSTVYLEALGLRAPLLRRFVADVFGHCDVLVTATLPMPVPRLEDTDIGGGAALWPTLQRLVRLTAPFNALGLPAVTVPAGRTANGLPIGVQCIGRPFDEAMCLRAAAAIERRSPR